MYISYAMGIAIMTPVFFLLLRLLPTWSGEAIAMLSAVPYLPLIPLVFRYSRVIWIFVDRPSSKKYPA
jgi:hypothetical protein